MTSEERTPDSVDQIVGEVRVLREHLHDLIERMQQEHAVWKKMLAELQERPRLTAGQRSRIRRHVETFERRQAT